MDVHNVEKDEDGNDENRDSDTDVDDDDEHLDKDTGVINNVVYKRSLHGRFTRY